MSWRPHQKRHLGSSLRPYTDHGLGALTQKIGQNHSLLGRTDASSFASRRQQPWWLDCIPLQWPPPDPFYAFHGESYFVLLFMEKVILFQNLVPGCLGLILHVIGFFSSALTSASLARASWSSSLAFYKATVEEVISLSLALVDFLRLLASYLNFSTLSLASSLVFFSSSLTRLTSLISAACFIWQMLGRLQGMYVNKIVKNSWSKMWRKMREK